jgi:hypothetical protein
MFLRCITVVDGKGKRQSYFACHSLKINLLGAIYTGNVWSRMHRVLPIGKLYLMSRKEKSSFA